MKNLINFLFCSTPNSMFLAFGSGVYVEKKREKGDYFLQTSNTHKNVKF